MGENRKSRDKTENGKKTLKRQIPTNTGIMILQRSQPLFKETLFLIRHHDLTDLETPEPLETDTGPEAEEASEAPEPEEPTGGSLTGGNSNG